MSFLVLVSDAEISETTPDLFILILPIVALGVEG